LKETRKRRRGVFQQADLLSESGWIVRAGYALLHHTVPDLCDPRGVDHPRDLQLDGILRVHAIEQPQPTTEQRGARWGSRSNRRIWADLGDAPPDGICIDAEGAVWFADVPNKRCVRVREGGEVLQTIELDRGGFACMLGGPDGHCLYSRPSGPVWRTWTTRRERVGSSSRVRLCRTQVGHRY
jgi:hypothetical protein